MVSPVLSGGLLAIEMADVLVVDVHVDEAAQLAVVVVQVTAEIAVFRDERLEQLSNGAAVDFHDILPVGEGPEWCRDQDPMGHIRCPHSVRSWFLRSWFFVRSFVLVRSFRRPRQRDGVLRSGAQVLLERLQRAADLHARRHSRRNGLGRGLVAVAGDADDHRLVGRNHAGAHQADGAGERRSAGRLGEDAFRLGQKLHRLQNLFVARRDARPAGRLDRLDHLEPVRRVADRDRLGDRRGLDRLGELDPVVQRANDRRAAGRLRGMDARQLPLHQADLAQLAESAHDPRQERPAGHRRHQVLREPPAELLDDLEPDGLRAFGVVGAEVDVREPPAELVRNLRAQPVHVVVVPANADDVRPEDGGPEDLPELEIVRDEDVALEPEARGMGGHAVGEVAGRGGAEHLEAELDRAGRRHRDDAVLVRQRRMVHGIIFYVQLPQTELPREPIGAHERRAPGVEARARLAGDGQKLPEPPDVLRPPLDHLSRERLAHARVVIHHLERPEALIADPQRLGGVLRPAQVALQPGHERHASPSR